MKAYRVCAGLAAGLVFFLAGAAGAGIGDFGNYSDESELITSSGTYDYYIVGDQGTNNLLVVSNSITMNVYYSLIGGDGGHNRMVVTDGASARLGLWRSPDPYSWYVMIGSNSSHNALVITNGASALVSYEPVLGWSPGADHNRLIINGAGSAFTNYRTTVGWSGSFNSIEISDGGRMVTAPGGTTPYAILGRGANSIGNSVTITGAGSVWELSNTNAYLYIGNASGSAGNTITVSEGGQLRYGREIMMGRAANASNNLMRVEGGAIVTNLYDIQSIGLGSSAGAHNNRLEIDGDGSQVYGTIRVGNAAGSTGNVVRITDGGYLQGGLHNYLGIWAGTSGNLLEISGDGSRAILEGSLFLGYAANTGNVARVEDGGYLWVDQSVQGGLIIGSSTVADYTAGHRLEIDGAGSKVELNTGAPLTMGNNAWSISNRLTVSNGGELQLGGEAYFGRGGDFNKARVESGGVVTNPTVNALLVGNTGRHNVLEVDGSGSRVYSTLSVGHSSGGNSNLVRVTGGGEIHAGGVNYVGLSGAYNTLEVSGDESKAYFDTLRVGWNLAGEGNKLRVEDGGYLEVNDGSADISNGLVLGYASPGNRLEIDGPGSEVVLTPGTVLMLSRMNSTSVSNVVTVSNGGRLELGGTAFIGHAGGYNEMLIDGGTVQGSANFIRVGALNTGYNKLILSNNAVLNTASNFIYVGQLAAAESNLVRVTGGSILSNNVDGTLMLGQSGSGNRLEIEGTGSKVYGRIRVAENSTSHSNLVSVTDGGYLGGGLFNYLGINGGYNEMLISGTGSEVELNGFLVAGNGSTSPSNTIRVQNGGKLSLGSASDVSLFVGNSGPGNRLLIDGAGSMVTSTGGGFRVGSASTANSNLLHIANDGRLELEGDTYIANAGGYNIARIESGGVMTNAGGFAWVGASGAHNELIVDGAGSMFGNASTLFIGHAAGTDNRVTVTNGGQVHLGALRVGYHAAAVDNEIHVSGAGSLFTVAGHSVIGRMGDGQRVRIEDGGRATFGQLWVSEGHTSYQEFFAHDNEILVTGTGSSLEAGDIYLGGTTASTARVIAEAGASGQSANFYVGHGVSSTGNYLRVTGAGSAWTNSGTLYVGYGGAQDNRLEIRDDAIVESGDTVVGAGGTLLLDAAYLDSNLTIEDGGSLEGDGIIQGFSVINAGRIAPGQSAGELEIWGNLTLEDTSLLEMELGGTAAGEYDRLLGFSTTIAFDGTLSVALIGGYDPQDGDTFTLFQDWDLAGSSGSFAVYDLPSLGPGLGWDRSDLESEGTLTVIPEPSTGLLLAAILGLLALRRRRR